MNDANEFQPRSDAAAGESARLSSPLIPVIGCVVLAVLVQSSMVCLCLDWGTIFLFEAAIDLLTILRALAYAELPLGRWGLVFYGVLPFAAIPIAGWTLHG